MEFRAGLASLVQVRAHSLFASQTSAYSILSRPPWVGSNSSWAAMLATRWSKFSSYGCLQQWSLCGLKLPSGLSDAQ